MWAFRKELPQSGWGIQEGVTPTAAEFTTRNEMSEALPRRFQFVRAKLAAWSKVRTPTCYISIKRKCHETSRKICITPGHACVRKIVSYAGPRGKPLLFPQLRPAGHKGQKDRVRRGRMALQRRGPGFFLRHLTYRRLDWGPGKKRRARREETSIRKHKLRMG